MLLVAKRSGEVIFFENAQKRGAVQKRSDISMDEWINKFYNNKNEDNDQQPTAVQEKVAADIDQSQQVSKLCAVCVHIRVGTEYPHSVLDYKNNIDLQLLKCL